ncbi:MAG: DUF4493 domain-containing protein [Duncaniella sp.]|nr:DUF4493 domain-containing protein [Duncaniella sp.]
MKSTYKYIAASVLMAAALTGCRDEHLMDGGEGTLRLSTTVNSEVEVVSRALSAEQEQALAESAVIWISNSKGLLYEYKGASKVPATLRLLSGHYTAEAWVGDSVPASWDKTFYKSGFNGFDIATGTNTDVTLNCRVANTLASVTYSDEALNMLTSPVMTIGLDDGITDGSHSLVFDESNPDAKGRFMINSRTKGLNWTLTGTEADGSQFTKSGKIENIKPATEYRLNVKFVGHDLSVGGAYFDIEVEEEPVGDESQIAVVLPPNIVGMLGFDKDGNFRGEQGKIDRKSMFISAATDLADVELTSSLFAHIVGGDGRIELLHIEGEPKQQLNAAGIDWMYVYDEETDMARLRVNLEDDFTNALPEGEYKFDIMAEDALGKVSNATFTITVTNAPVAPSPVQESNISYTSATLEAQKLKEASEYGFEIRQATASRSYEDWTRVPATVSGSRIYAEVSDLKPGTTYESRPYADDYVSPETVTFTTVAYPQLPNSGFEDWSGSSPLLICASEAAMFWDSGNHGSATMKKNVTEKDGSVKHSGNYSAKLTSQFVGVGSLGKFAAGNIFVGKYLKTDGTDGILGWGREWNVPAEPKALKVWARYSPGKVQKSVYDNAAGSKIGAPQDILDEFPTGSSDKGIIYVALVSFGTPDSDYPDYPVIIKTKKDNRQLFDKNGANVKAYGEVIFTEATSEFKEYTVNLTEVNPGVKYTHILVVASASKAGDYFLGGEGSTLWLDDIELVY